MELGQLDLQPGFVSPGAGGEDVENHFAAIDDDPAGLFFEVSLLRGGEVVVENDQVGPADVDHLLELLQLALSQTSGGDHLSPNLGHAAHDLDAGRLHQPSQLVESMLPMGLLRGVQDADQDRLALLDTQIFAFWISQLSETTSAWTLDSPQARRGDSHLGGQFQSTAKNQRRQ